MCKMSCLPDVGFLAIKERFLSNVSTTFCYIVVDTHGLFWIDSVVSTVQVSPMRDFAHGVQSSLHLDLSDNVNDKVLGNVRAVRRRKCSLTGWYPKSKNKERPHLFWISVTYIGQEVLRPHPSLLVRHSPQRTHAFSLRHHFLSCEGWGP